MGLLNLPLAQFLPLFGAIAAFSVALYMLDRTRRRQVVATLRFWTDAGNPSPITRRTKIQQPISLLLQLLGMFFLLLAVAEFQFGGRQSVRRDHVLVLDTSAWMGAAAPGRQDQTLMDLARASALGWLRAVPSADRVLLVRADGLATPATAWDLDRRTTARAILESQPGSTTLNLSQSLEFASRMQHGSGSVAGEIVYAGPGRITTRETTNMSLPSLPAFRILTTEDSTDNAGLRSVGARRSPDDPGTWDVIARVRNYGTAVRPVSVTLNFGNVPQGVRPIEIPPGEEREVTFAVHTRAAGLLEARLYPKDAFAADNYAALELPELRSLRVVVYSDQLERIRPALASDSRVAAEFHPTAQYTPEQQPGSLVVLHRFRPPAAPQGNVLWVDSPDEALPARIRERVSRPEGLRWTPDQAVTAGLRARDVQIESAAVYSLGPGQTSLAEIDKGPVMAAQISPDGKTRMVMIGFDPFSGAMRYELATPILLGNILRWFAPEVFRDVDVGTQSAGAVDTPVSDSKSAIQVLTDNGTALPFTVRDRAVQFFAGDAARVRVLAGNTERVYSLTLPEMWDVKWTPPANARRGVPAWNDAIRRNADWWPFLALLGVALLLAEWFIYGRHSTTGLHVVKARTA